MKSLWAITILLMMTLQPVPNDKDVVMNNTIEKNNDFQKIMCCECGSTLVILLHEAVPGRCPACKIAWEDVEKLGTKEGLRARR